MKDRILHEKVEYKCIREMVEAIGDLYGDKIALRFKMNPHDKETTTKSYVDLRDDVRALATELLARGYKGKHIVVIGKHSYPWIVTYFATMAMGAVLVPLDKDWGALELSDTVKTADASVISCDPYTDPRRLSSSSIFYRGTERVDQPPRSQSEEEAEKGFEQKCDPKALIPRVTAPCLPGSCSNRRLDPQRPRNAEGKGTEGKREPRKFLFPSTGRPRSAVLCFIALHRYRVFYKLNICTNPALSKSISATFPIALCSLRVSVSHFGNSHNISSFFITIILVIVICDQ